MTASSSIANSANNISALLVNKRLDEWVTEEYLDTRKVQFPRKDGSATGHNTGVTTPKKHLSNSVGAHAANSSRPTSPKAEVDGELVNGNAVMAAALQKKMNRKRKVYKRNEELSAADPCGLDRSWLTGTPCVFVFRFVGRLGFTNTD